MCERMVLTSVKLAGIVGYGADVQEAIKDAKAKAEATPAPPYRVVALGDGITLSKHSRLEAAQLLADYNSYVIGACEVWDSNNHAVYVAPEVV